MQCGSALAPVIQFVTNLIYNLMKAIQMVAYALTGVNIFANATASSMKSVAGSTKQANKEAKQLAGVHDEINNIADNNSGNSGGGGGGISPSIDLSQMDDTPNSIIEAIRNGDWYKVGEEIASKLNDAMSSIDWTKIQDGAKTIATNIGNFINGFVNKLDWNLLGYTIGQGINTAFIFVDTLFTTINFENIGKSIATGLNSEIKTIDWNLIGKTFADGINAVINLAYGFVKNFDFHNFGTSIATSINSFFKNIEWGKAGETLGDGIKGIFNGISGFFETFDWSFIIDGLVDFVKNIDWGGVADSIFQALGSACASLVNLGMVIGEYIGKAFDGIGKFFNDKIEEAGGNVVLGIFNGIIEALGNLGQWIIDHIFTPFINGFKNVFGIHSPSTVMAEMGGYIIDGLKNGLKNIWDKVKEIFSTLKTNIKDKFNDIKDKVKTIAENIKTAVKDKFDSMKTKITTIAENIKTKVKDKFDSMKTKVTTTVTNIKTKVTSIWDTIKSNIQTKVTTIKDKVTSAFTTIKTKIKSIMDSVKTTIKSIWDGIWNTIKGVINSILGGIEKFANGIVRGINKVIDAMNKLHFDIPDWVPGLGGKSLGFNVKSISEISIPRLAKGGVIDNPTVALMGEYSGASSNPEIVAPQNIMAETFERVLSDYLSSSNNDRPINLTVNVGNKKLGQILLDDLRDRRRQTGKGLEALVGG